MNTIYWIVGTFVVLLVAVIGIGLWSARQERELFKKLRWKVVFSPNKPKDK